MKQGNNNQRTFVLGIDGTPFSFLEQRFAQGKMPNLAKVAQGFGMRRINSVYPTISSLAWTSYATGKNPAEHNIFGFVDRVANPFQIRIPTAKDRKAETIWSELSRKNKKVIVINVPLTYPPDEVNGILVSGFLCTDIEKSSYPAEFSAYLKSKGYIIDADAWLARSNKKKEFMDQLHRALEKRFELTLGLMEKEQWDFFQLHIMETDRLFHFFWDDIEGKGEFSEDVETFFTKLDNFVERIRAKLTDKDRLLILSDHGFCGIKNEVQLNLWLQEQGLLKYEDGAKKKLANYDRNSLCYCLIPGRIFINLEGREEKGSVRKDGYKKVRQDVKERLLNLRNPQSGERVIDKAFFREEIYDGPYLEDAADIIAHPARGYDLKGKTEANKIFDSSALNGMHTYDDAFICGKNFDLSSVTAIQDVKQLIINEDN